MIFDDVVKSFDLYKIKRLLIQVDFKIFLDLNSNRLEMLIYLNSILKSILKMLSRCWSRFFYFNSWQTILKMDSLTFDAIRHVQIWNSILKCLNRLLCIKMACQNFIQSWFFNFSKNLINRTYSETSNDSVSDNAIT